MDEILGSDVTKEYMKLEEFLKDKNKNTKIKENRPESEKTQNNNNILRQEDLSMNLGQDSNMNSLNQINLKDLNVNTQSLNNENYERFFEIYEIFLKILFFVKISLFWTNFQKFIICHNNFF